MSSLASSQLSQLQSDHLPVGSRAERARQLFEEARIFYLTRYGQNSQKAAETCCDLGDIMRLHERFRESKSLYEAGLIALKPRHDILHPRVAHLIFGLADVIRKDSNVFADHDPHGIRSISPASRERLAGRLLEEALVIFRTVYSDDNPFVVATANALASIMSTQMRYDRAISLYQQSLTSARSALKRAQGAQQKDKETVKIPPILLTIAGLHDKMKRYDLAEPFYQEALSTYRDLYGYKHVCVADALCLLARSIDLRGREPVPDDIEIEDDKVEHGEMLQYLSKPSDGYDEAAHHLRDALNIYSALRMQDTPMAVKAWKQLALLHEGKN
jgi:tetratricopeptide (TPR) repeat protein